MVDTRTLIGGTIEVFAAQLFVVCGLAMQKVAVMKIIETNRLRAAEEDAATGRVEGSGADGGGEALGDEDGLLGVSPRQDARAGDTGSEIMTVVSEATLLEQDPGAVNDTQVPDVCDLFSSRVWLLGFLVFLIGNISELVALSLASQTDIALLTNFALIWNTLVSVFIFKEGFNVKPMYCECSYRLVRRWDLFHIVILLFGCMLAVVCTPATPEDDRDAKELLHQWGSPPYVYWGGFMLVAMFIASLILVRNWRNLKTGNLNAALIAGLCGFMSAFCVTLSKVATTLLSQTIRGHNQFGNPEAVFLTCLWLTMLLTQLFLLNVALGAFEQGLVIPIYEVTGTIASITSGILFYRTYKDFTELGWYGFGVGVAMMCWGVWLVAHREVHSAQELSNSLYENLSAVDDLLRLPGFVSPTNTASQSAALGAFEEGRGGYEHMDDATRRLYGLSDDRAQVASSSSAQPHMATSAARMPTRGPSTPGRAARADAASAAPSLEYTSLRMASQQQQQQSTPPRGQQVLQQQEQADARTPHRKTPLKITSSRSKQEP
jgi:hypothetical protein